MALHPTEESLNITRKFLAGGQGPSSQTSPVASQRVGGQQGARRGQGGRAASLLPRLLGDISTLETGPSREPRREAGPRPTPLPRLGLFDAFQNLPGPVEFARTSPGRSLLQRLLLQMRNARR